MTDMRLFALVFLACFLFVSGDITAWRNCQIDSFEVQKNFSQEQFTGEWRVIWYNMITESPQVLIDIQNPKELYLDFKYNQNGKLTFEATGQFHHTQTNATICLKYQGVQYTNDTDATLVFEFAPLYGTQSEIVTYYILYTDYENSAIVYSCELRDVNDECVNGHAQFWVLSRKQKLNGNKIKLRMIFLWIRTCVGETFYIKPITYEEERKCVSCSGTAQRLSFWKST